MPALATGQAAQPAAPTAPQTAQSGAAKSSTASSSSAQPQPAPVQIIGGAAGEKQVHEEEQQRILGAIPNFYASFLSNNVALSPKQKFQLAFANAFDPFDFVAAGLDAGYEQAEDQFEGYGEGIEGFAKRTGASYADTFDGIILGSAVFPVLLREDPRYFRMAKGSITKRTLYAISTEFITKNDNGTWGPNYANIAGNLAAGGISNFYYPQQDRGLTLTLERAAFDTVEGALGAIVVEFWPDIAQHFSHKKHATAAPQTAPAASAQH